MASFLSPNWPTFYFQWKYSFLLSPTNCQPTRQNLQWLDRQDWWNVNDIVHASLGPQPIEQLKGRELNYWFWQNPSLIFVFGRSIENSSTFRLISNRYKVLWNLLMVTVECEPPLFWERFCGNVLIAWAVTVTFSYPDSNRFCNLVAFQHFSTSYLGSFSGSYLGSFLRSHLVPFQGNICLQSNSDSSFDLISSTISWNVNSSMLRISPDQSVNNMERLIGKRENG